MHWKALIVKGERNSNNIVGIVIYRKKTQVIYILGELNGLGLKNKWKNPMKIKRWLLYDYHSNSFASIHLSTLFFFGKSLTYLDGSWELECFDKSIIEKKFPGMAGIAFPKEKEKRK